MKMSNILKYKAKRMDNSEWIYSHSIFKPRTVALHKWHGCVFLNDDTDTEATNPRCWIEVQPKTVCQSNGKDDINGRYIYHGDMITVYDYGHRGYFEGIPEYPTLIYNGICLYAKEEFQWILLGYDETSPVFNANKSFSKMSQYNKYKIISNVFDSKSLLDDYTKARLKAYGIDVLES